jgi:hypothetical protein
MSLGDKLQSAAVNAASKACKVGALLYSSAISKQDKQNLETILSANPDDPTRVANTTLGKILREEGYDISNSAVDRHRRGDCACTRLAK